MKTKSILTYVLILIIPFLILYLAGSFICLNFNYMEWSENARFAIISFSLFISGIISIVRWLASF